MSKLIITVVLVITSVGWFIEIKINAPSAIAQPRVVASQALLLSSPSDVRVDNPYGATLHYGDKCYA